MDLKSLQSIFNEKILRIPDYQRGYAWNKHQLEDFWEDLLVLNKNKVHYTGVITLEAVSEEIWSKWENDTWLIDSLGFKPFYVVDGQQRLTTSMILIQAIIESVPDGELIFRQKPDSILKKYILHKADNEEDETYIFGYEKDNPSDEYLRTKIFGNHSYSDVKKETLYTRNLQFAKDFFTSELKKLNTSEVENLFKKLTQQFKFNIYEINDEIDVFVTFETMNNRGKPLSNLELLKNRLIYLSTLFDENSGKEKLRRNINDAWKTMYEYLGKNPDNLLNDNIFLRNHWVMYFEEYSRKKGNDYIDFLLDEKFNAKNVTHPISTEKKLKIEEISKYIKSLQKSVVWWFYIHNPYFSDANELTNNQKIGLDRLERLSFRSFKPLILSALVSEQHKEDTEKLLDTAERYNFLLFNISQRRTSTGDTAFYGLAKKLLDAKIEIENVLETIKSLTKRFYDPDRFSSLIKEKYELEQDGFYRWDGVRYFLYEYEQWLKDQGKQATDKLTWETVKSNKKDNVTLEHIFPQTPTDSYWIERFGQLSKVQQTYLTHSLGNLVPLSRAKNSSLQNDGFDKKKNNGNKVGYYNGSISENEVNQYPEWTPLTIKNRGLELLKFMEERWNIELGDAHYKNELLHLDTIEELHISDE